MVDLIIDESDPNNYFIDFEINRLTGNLPQDYNQQNNQENIYNPYAQQQPLNVPTTYGQPQSNYQFQQTTPVMDNTIYQNPVMQDPNQGMNNNQNNPQN